MTFPANTGPDGGWSLAHDGGGRTFQDFRGDVSGSNHAGTISFSGGDVMATTYGAFRSITATRQVRVEYYINIYESGAITDWDGGAVLQIDDGDANDHTIMTSTTETNLPANLFSMQVTIEEDPGNASNVLYTPRLFYRFSSGSSTGILLSDVGDFTYSRTKPDETDIWVGFKFEVTDSYVKVWIDKTNNGIWDPLVTSRIWVSPFSGTPFTQVRVMTDDPGAGTSIQVGMDSVIVDDIQITSANEWTTNIIPDSISASNATRGGGQLTFKYKDPWLADFATVEAFYHKTVLVTNKDLIPFSKYKVVEIQPNIHDYTITCHQLSRELEHTPANHNPIVHEGIVGQIIDTPNWKLYDRDAAFGDLTTLSHYLSFGDVNKKVCSAQPTGTSLTPSTIVEESDMSTNFTPNDTRTPIADTREGNPSIDLFWQDENITTVSGNMIGAYELSNAAGDSNTDWAFIIVGDIFLKDGATPQTAVLRLDHYHVPKSGFITSAQFPRIMIYDYTNTVWVTLKTLSSADMDTYKTLTASGGAGIFPTAVGFNQWVLDIGSEIVDYLDSVGAANSQGFQQYNWNVAIVAGVASNWWGTAFPGLPAYCKFFDLAVTTDNENFVTQGIGKVSSNTSTVITLDETFEVSPYEDGINRNDQYWITKGIDGILDGLWTDSGASSLFSLDNGLSGLKGDGIDYLLVKVAFILNKFADVEGKQWWQDNDPTVDYIRIKDPESSGITLTEATILDYITEGSRIRGTTKYMRNKVEVAGAYNSFHSETLSPAVANTRVQLYEKPELVTSDQCKEYAQQRTSFHQDIQYQGTVPYIWSDNRLNIEVGNTMGVKIGAGGDHDYTDATGTGNLFVKEILLVQSGNKIRASASLTSYFTGLEESL